MNEFDPASHKITDEQKAKLKALFPEAFTEQGIDFDRLKTLLGEAIETGPERYSFTWPGKTEAIRAAQASSMGTLVPDKGSSIDWDTTENLYLEGDNLEILKLLQKSYTGKVKMIYIDPPYNTGKDFVYPDNYGEGLKTYLEYTGQIDGEGKKLTTNTETDGRYHSKWLNMMYPRLMLARNLLKDDGVIFASIDDHEIHNLRKIMNEIFGEENFIADIVVVNNFKGRNDKRYIATAHERLLMFVKSDLFEESGLKLPEEREQEFRKQDSIGMYRSLGLRKRGGADTREERPKMYFPIYINPKSNSVSLVKTDEFTIEIYPKKSDGSDGCWRWGYDNVSRNLESLEGLPVGNAVGYDIFEKDYLETDGSIRRIKPKSVMIGSNYSTDGATKSFTALFGRPIFDNPKSVSFISDLVSYSTNPDSNDIILDFFSGSATTAHAVMALNAEDGGNRRFILSQIQEQTPEDSEARKAGYSIITKIGKERIRRAGSKILEEYAEKIAARETLLDAGFKTYRLTSSTFNVWDVKTQDNIQEKLISATSLIRGDAKEDDVLTELILKSGYGLTEKIEKFVVDGKSFFSVVGGALVISLESGLKLEQIRQVAEKKPTQFVAREHGFASDDVLTNTAQIMKDKGIDFRVL